MSDSDNENARYNNHIITTIRSTNNDNLNFMTFPIKLDNSHTRECPIYLWAGLVMRPNKIPVKLDIPLLFFPLAHRPDQNGYSLFHSLLKLITTPQTAPKNDLEKESLDENDQSNPETPSRDNFTISFNQTITLNIPLSSEGDYLINPRRDKGPITPSFSYTILQWMVIHQYFLHVNLLIPSEPVPHYLLDQFRYPPDRFEFESPLRECDLEDPWDSDLWERFGDHRFYHEAEENDLLIDSMVLMIEGWIDSILNNNLDEIHPEIEHEFDFWPWA
jgi:hypothetical protein